MKVSTENDNNFGYEKITILVDNMPLTFQQIPDLEITSIFQSWLFLYYLNQNKVYYYFNLLYHIDR
jgi:hypothetical protein